MALAGALALAGCGAGSSAQTANETSAPASATAADGAATSLMPAGEGKVTYPLTLETPWGSTELTERPQKIAAVTPSQDDVEILAALGVTPYLASEYGNDVWTEEVLATPIPERFTRGDDPIPVEQIAKADPDLIVVLGTDLTDTYDKLSAIAPVFATAEAGANEKSNANDWDANIKAVAEVLDLQDAGAQVIEDEDAFFTDFRAANPDLEGVTASYVVYYGDNGGLQFHSSEGSPAGNTLEAMGLDLAPKAGELTYRQEISSELVSEIDADIIIFSDNSNGAHDKVTGTELFQNLNAVKDDHLILIDNRDGSFAIDGEEHEGNLPWALARSGPLSGTWAATQIAPAIVAAVGK